MFWINPSDQLVHVHRYGSDVVAVLCTCEQMKNDVVNVVHMLSGDLIKQIQNTWLAIYLTLSYYNLILFYILYSIQSGLVILVTPIRASPHKNLLKHPIFLHHLPANRFSGVCLLPPITASA